LGVIKEKLMKKILNATKLIAALMGVLLLVGCGGSDGLDGLNGATGATGATGADGNTALGSLRVNVTQPDGTPISPFTATLQRSGVVARGESDGVLAQQQGPGFYIFENLAEGTYRLVVDAPGFGTFQDDVDVLGQEQTVTVNALFPVPIYGIGIDGNAKTTDFYNITPDTGATAFVGPVGSKKVFGIATHPTTGVIYAAGRGLVDDESYSLFSIDRLTGAPTEIAAFTNPNVNEDCPMSLAFRSDGVLFAVINGNSQPGSQKEIAQVDLTTAALSNNQNINGLSVREDDLDAIAFSEVPIGAFPVDTLFFTHYDDGPGETSLYTLNPADGTFTLLDSITTNDEVVQSLSFQPGTATLYASIGPSESAPTLATIDIVTRNITLIGGFNLPGVDNMAITWRR
jgi:hypothetical protein